MINYRYKKTFHESSKTINILLFDRVTYPISFHGTFLTSYFIYVVMCIHCHDLQLPVYDFSNLSSKINLIKQYKIQLCNISYCNLKEKNVTTSYIIINMVHAVVSLETRNISTSLIRFSIPSR